MQGFFSNIRFYVLISSALLSLLIFGYIQLTSGTSNTDIEKLTRAYALFAFAYLYLALLATPLIRLFPRLPFAGQYIKARRAIGVSTLYFASLHATIAFFFQLGGFSGLQYLSNTYLIAITLSATALLILCAMASTSFDKMISKLSYPKWKILHRFVYLAALFILIHAFLLGTDFSNLHSLFTQTIFTAIIFLFLLEAIRIDIYLRKKLSLSATFGPAFVLTFAFSVGSFIVFLLPNNILPSFNIHSAHLQLAQQALQQNLFTNANTSIPGLNGDRNKRYTVSMSVDQTNPQPNQDVTIHFRVYDASSGNPISFFRILYAWPMHLMTVDSGLSYFNHIHPTQQGREFIITTQFPKPGVYHLYIQFQPFGGIEQQMAFVLPVGVEENDKPEFSTQPVDKQNTKVFGDYEVDLDTHGILNASAMTVGSDKLSFTIKDAKTKRPVTTLKPFMASFGHLTMINEKTYDFIHVHPYSLTIPQPNANGGPTVDFLPIGIYGPFQPGIYRVFAEFSTKAGTDFDADFTIRIE